MNIRRPITVAALLACAGSCFAGSPDLIIATMQGITKWTPTPGPGGVQAYSFGIVTCNVGDGEAAWQASTALHPAFTQNIYRIANGRVEQIGLGMVSHGFFPLQQAQCGPCTPAGGSQLGIGCSTADSASFMGQQSLMGLRSDVNPATGAFVWPLPPSACDAPSSICERVAVAEADLADPSALYLAETIVVHPGDAASGAGSNNATSRRLLVGPDFNLTTSGAALNQSAVQAWQSLNNNGLPDPDINVSEVLIPDDGALHIGSKAIPIGNGRWRYIIAVENLSSDRAVSELAVSMGADPSPMGFTFHDVDYISGEMFDETDWGLLIGDASFRWRSPETFDQNPNTNALRWGTLYTFSFTSVAGPIDGQVMLTLFKPGTPQAVGAEAVVPGSEITWCPGDVNADGYVNFSDLNLMLGTYGQAGVDLFADVDADGEVGFSDLNLLLGNFGQDC